MSRLNSRSWTKFLSMLEYRREVFPFTVVLPIAWSHADTDVSIHILDRTPVDVCKQSMLISISSIVTHISS